MLARDSGRKTVYPKSDFGTEVRFADIAKVPARTPSWSQIEGLPALISMVWFSGDGPDAPVVARDTKRLLHTYDNAD
jgi:hypothetical protein